MLKTAGKSINGRRRSLMHLFKTRNSAIAGKLRALFRKVVEVLKDFLSENVDKKFTTDYNVA